MASKVNRPTWVRLLEEDIVWLRAQPRTLERDHVIATIEALADNKKPGSHAFYDAQPAPWPPA